MEGIPAVIIVDFQREWTMEESPYFLGTVDVVAEKCETLVDEALSRNLPVVYTQRFIDRGFEGVFTPYADRSDLYESLPEDDRIEIIDRKTWDPFHNTDLENFLLAEDVGSVVVGGMAINAGVRECVTSAYNRDFDVTVVEDCCFAETSEEMQFTLQDMKKYRDVEVDVLRNFELFLGE